MARTRVIAWSDVVHVRDADHAESLLRDFRPELSAAERGQWARELAEGSALLVLDDGFELLDADQSGRTDIEPLGPEPFVPEPLVPDPIAPDAITPDPAPDPITPDPAPGPAPDPITPSPAPGPSPAPVGDTFVEVVLVDDAGAPVDAAFELTVNNAPHAGRFPSTVRIEPIDHDADCALSLTAITLQPRPRTLG